jgi:ribose transport system permease protein
MSAVDEAARSRLTTRLRLYRRRAVMTRAIGPAFVLVSLFILYVIVQPSALKPSQFGTIVDGAAAVGIAAAGETIIVIAGGFDLSVGSVLSLINVIIVTQIRPSIVSQLTMVLLAVLIGAGVGTLNGALVVLLRIPSIVATLAMSFLWGGVALLILAQPGGSMPIEFVSWFTAPSTLVLLLIVVGVWLAIKRTPIGRWLYAVGGDVAAARSQGVRVGLVSIFAYALGGAFYGIAAIVLTAQSSSGDPNIGTALLITVFAAVVIGGTAFGGGVGDVVGSVMGAYILYLINNVLYALGVSSFYTNILNGMVLILAVVAGTLTGIRRLPIRFPWRSSDANAPDQAGVS